MKIVGLDGNRYNCHCHLGLRFKSFVKPSLVYKLNALLFEKRDGWLDKKVLYKILRSDLFLAFIVPPFHFFVCFYSDREPTSMESC